MKDDDVISILVHGDSKVGKSTFTSTAPPPILVLDAEGSWKFIRRVGFTGAPLRVRQWDAMTAPPRHDGTWDVCRVNVTSWDTIQRVYTWITQGEHDFKSVVLDSITELQRRLKLAIAADGVIKGYDGWGALLSRMDMMIRSVRDLTLVEHNPIKCVVFVSESSEHMGRWTPAMQGQIRSQLPYWVDVCGYMYASSVLAEDGQTTQRQVHMWIAPHEKFVAGERVAGLLPNDIVDPNITSMLTTIYPTQDNGTTSTEENLS